jgi:hypothetical protein
VIELSATLSTTTSALVGIALTVPKVATATTNAKHFLIFFIKDSSLMVIVWLVFKIDTNPLLETPCKVFYMYNSREWQNVAKIFKKISVLRIAQSLVDIFIQHYLTR